MIRRIRGSAPLLAGSVIAAAGLVFGSLSAAISDRPPQIGITSSVSTRRDS